MREDVLDLDENFGGGYFSLILEGILALLVSSTSIAAIIIVLPSANILNRIKSKKHQIQVMDEIKERPTLVIQGEGENKKRMQGALLKLIGLLFSVSLFVLPFVTEALENNTQETVFRAVVFGAWMVCYALNRSDGFKDIPTILYDDGILLKDQFVYWERVDEYMWVEPTVRKNGPHTLQLKVDKKSSLLGFGDTVEIKAWPMQKEEIENVLAKYDVKNKSKSKTDN
ncbi:hypothetical protein RH915_07225 [Serpentinicella sp. ANB-PHB4]|uniref:hypothetical protein n=1 Tax=Serpentinicella sp. ANB-PHB4 TaxID=3074076 RepID=UPI0028556588|nr:hypothetical protein [Serpentinicella sp. ANB-PHB4]MDR5659277.1 hypothetical protein [Serpentinicella sp. ANB-PHB4]